MQYFPPNLHKTQPRCQVLEYFIEGAGGTKPEVRSGRLVRGDLCPPWHWAIYRISKDDRQPPYKPSTFEQAMQNGQFRVQYFRVQDSSRKLFKVCCVFRSSTLTHDRLRAAGNNLKRYRNFDFKAKARIWPWTLAWTVLYVLDLLNSGTCWGLAVPGDLARLLGPERPGKTRQV